MKRFKCFFFIQINGILQQESGYVLQGLFPFVQIVGKRHFSSLNGM